jgi:uncharacterized protein with HEPN domain
MRDGNFHVYVADILEAIQRIEEFLDDLSFEEFSKDKKTLHAVVWNFAVIGEAAKQVPIDVKKMHPEIAWNRMAGMRDKVIHGYFGVDENIVWDAAKVDLPTQKPLLKKLLKKT